MKAIQSAGSAAGPLVVRLADLVAYQDGSVVIRPHRRGSRLVHNAMRSSDGIGRIPGVIFGVRAIVVTRAARVGYVLVGARGFEPPASCSGRNAKSLSNKDLRSSVEAGGGG